MTYNLMISYTTSDIYKPQVIEKMFFHPQHVLFLGLGVFLMSIGQGLSDHRVFSSVVTVVIGFVTKKTRYGILGSMVVSWFP